jgi:hypothetical protein
VATGSRCSAASAPCLPKCFQLLVPTQYNVKHAHNDERERGRERRFIRLTRRKKVKKGIRMHISLLDASYE